MAVGAALTTKVFVGAFRFDSGNSAQFTPTVAALEGPTWGSGSFSAVYAGLKSWSLDFGGYADFDAGAVSATMRPLLGSTEVATITPEGSAAGSLALITRGLIQAVNPFDGSVGALPTVTVPLRNFGVPVAQGLVSLAETTAITGTTNGSACELGAVSASQRVYAAVHVLSITGSTPTLQPILQSDDNSGFTSATAVATGTAVSAAGTQWLSAAGAITDTFFRVRLVATGTVSAASVLCAIAIA